MVESDSKASDFKAFYESINKELDAVKGRVRNIIGDANWGEEGRYKEILLRNVISKFLPKSFSLGTGFVINAKDEKTKQLDIIVYDHASPLLFSEGEFVIPFASSVRAIIEVKTSIRGASDLNKIMQMCEDNSNIISSRATASARPFFNGIFAYDSSNLSNLETTLRERGALPERRRYLKKVNNVSLGPDLFLHHTEDDQDHIGLMSSYKLGDLSFAYFISNLLVSLEELPLRNEHEHQLFPLDSKEPFVEFKVDW